MQQSVLNVWMSYPKLIILLPSCVLNTFTQYCTIEQSLPLSVYAFLSQNGIQFRHNAEQVWHVLFLYLTDVLRIKRYWANFVRMSPI